jgi:hypothetical protein
MDTSLLPCQPRHDASSQLRNAISHQLESLRVARLKVERKNMRGRVRARAIVVPRHGDVVAFGVLLARDIARPSQRHDLDE